ncbi:uncharacterized protein LOC123501274 [Portunus trituberculatus]|uniref:uncharacterized protein LOC123501274 n=1 Tax=Portunus trituberculatus TaxID=210409 RepID=UPI001E1CC761|nr:uncharacterized protein LOC123501274 [Portunus trituberculatus]
MGGGGGASGGGSGGRGGEEVGAALLEAYSALTCCLLPDHVIAHLVLPPLLQLQKWLGGASFDYMETLTDLVKEYSLRTQTAATNPPERRKPSLSLSGGLPPPNVEEVRTKMSKMFSTSSSTSSTSSSSSSSLQARAQAINASLPGFLKKK